MNNTKDNPFAQDSIPIGTVVDWEGRRVEVISQGSCKGCYFHEEDTQDCLNRRAKCYPANNTDGKLRKYILINEQQEKQTMTQDIQIGTKVKIIGGDRPDAVGFIDTVIKVLPKRDKPYYIEGEYFIYIGSLVLR